MVEQQTLQHQVALVTGGARGIGEAIVKKLAHEGCDVIIAYYNSSDRAEALCHELHEMGRRAISVQVNVADKKSICEMFDEITQTFDTIDILVSNAASGVLKSTLEMSTKHWRWCMETNALALVHLVQAAKPYLPRGSRVLALSSLGASRGAPNYGFIGASKAALESLVRTLSLELAPNDITVNTVSAGVVDTDALKYFPDRELFLESTFEKSLSERPLSVDDVAGVIYLLCLPEANMIKGQTIVVDAGYSVLV